MELQATERGGAMVVTGNTWPNAGGIGKLLSRQLVLQASEASFAVRGFAPAADLARQLRLEEIGETFIFGFNTALRSSSLELVQDAISALPKPFHGFAYEGAAMGAACADALPLTGTGRLRALLTTAPQHDYLMHVGVGWAMARVPWLRWTLLPRLDPLLSWLAWDGRGFHDLYFKRAKLENGWRRGGYAARAYDQGMGRALWFFASGDIVNVLERIAAQAPGRHNDLFGGLGLALTYAGGASEQELQMVVEQAGASRAALAQGAAFAVEARTQAGNMTAEADTACEILAGRSAEACVSIVQQHRPLADNVTDNPVSPAYETWRQTVQTDLSNP